VQHPRVGRRVEIRVGAVQQTAVVPHQQVARPPGMAVEIARLGRMRFEAQDERPAFLEGHALDVGGMHAGEDRRAPGLRVNARQRMGIVGRVCEFFRRHHPALVFARETPAVHHTQVADLVLLGGAQAFEGRIHVDEHRVAAFGRQGDGMQDRRHRGFRTEGLVGVPHVGAHAPHGFAVLVEIVDDVHQRQVGSALVALGVALQSAELFGEGDLLFLGQALAAEHQKLVVEESRMDGVTGGSVERVGEIEPDNLRRHQLRKGRDGEGGGISGGAYHDVRFLDPRHRSRAGGCTFALDGG